MACNSCAKSFSILRSEKGCPGCGFSYCSKCLKEKVFLQKINSEAKVCLKCKRAVESNEPKKFEPPDAYYKRIGLLDNGKQLNNDLNPGASKCSNPDDQKILDRLNELKKDRQSNKNTTNDEIASRLQKLHGDIPSTSDAELQQRLANIKGVPVTSIRSKPMLLSSVQKSEQEQVNDLMKQYLEQTDIDTKYKEDFESVVDDIERRLQNLRGSSDAGVKPEFADKIHSTHDSDDEETIKNIIEKAKKETSLQIEDDGGIEELPFCEICNEDAKMRCLGCKYLFCKRCFMEHRDDDDGCDKYETYSQPKHN